MPCHQLFVTLRVEHYGVSLLAVTSCSSCLLEVGFESVGKLIVDDESYVRLVDAHAEGVGCHHHSHLVVTPCTLSFVFSGRFKSGVIESGAYSVLLQYSVYVFRSSAASQIYDGATANRLQYVYELRFLVVRFSYHISQVLAYEAHLEHVRLLESKPFLNVHRHTFRCRCSKGEDRYVRFNVAYLCYIKI